MRLTLFVLVVIFAGSVYAFDDLGTLQQRKGLVADYIRLGISQRNIVLHPESDELSPDYEFLELVEDSIEIFPDGTVSYIVEFLDLLPGNEDVAIASVVLKNKATGDRFTILLSIEFFTNFRFFMASYTIGKIYSGYMVYRRLVKDPDTQEEYHFIVVDHNSLD
jgi:hypothetical protein